MKCNCSFYIDAFLKAYDVPGREREMKKKSIAKMFFISLAKSIGCILIILAVGFISYKISYTILSDEAEENSMVAEVKEIQSDAKIDDISKNLIYVTDDKNRIVHLILEICNTKTYNMDYVTIPVKTNYEIPSTMYRQLLVVNNEIPQIIRLSKLNTYFEKESDAYGYGVLIFEKMLGIDISYYTAISEDVYESHYRDQKVTVGYKTKSDIYNTPGLDGVTPVSTVVMKIDMKISVLSDAHKRQLKDMGGSEEKILNYIKNEYERLESNFSRENKSSYISAYQKMNPDLFHYWGIPCTKEDDAFVVNKKAAKKMLKALEQNSETYTTAQDLSMLNQVVTGTSSGTGNTTSADSKETEETVSDSKDLRIYVLNGSQIAGLASRTKERLEGAGYQVGGIGNYTAETLTHTQIIVKSESQGKDLESYFEAPERLVGQVESGYDIQIILGTADANRQ